VLKIEILLEGKYRIHKLASDFSGAINNLTDIWETSDGSSSVESREETNLKLLNRRSILLAAHIGRTILSMMDLASVAIIHHLS
jgi:hypothetical protein